MLRSMTGFGKCVREGSNFAITVELKTVNSKVLDFGSLRLPIRYRSYESRIRSMLTKGIERGKVDLIVSLVWKEGQEPQLHALNTQLFAMQLANLRSLCATSALQCSDDTLLQVTMQSEGIWKQVEELPSDEEQLLLDEAVLGAIDEVNNFREKEAQATARDFQEHLAAIRSYATEINTIKDRRPEAFRLRFETELAALKTRKEIEIDEGRMLQEILYHIQRLDVNEELQRLEQHCVYFLQVLENGASQGRKLGFIAQEMGREINTLGSKACDNAMQHLVVQMKDELEKIKEQVLNVL